MFLEPDYYRLVSRLAGNLILYPWVWLQPHPASTVLMYAAVWPALFAVLLGLARLLPRAGDRRGLYIICFGLAVCGGHSIRSALTTPDASPQSYWGGDVLMQTTDSTCIAAATVTYLRTVGIHSDELTAARQGLIGPQGGRLAQAWRILKLSVPADLRVRIGPVDREAFADGQWRVVSIRLLLNEGHALCAQMLPDGTMQIRDPANGEYFQSWDDFAAAYQGVGVWAESADSGDN